MVGPRPWSSHEDGCKEGWQRERPGRPVGMEEKGVRLIGRQKGRESSVGMLVDDDKKNS